VSVADADERVKIQQAFCPFECLYKSGVVRSTNNYGGKEAQAGYGRYQLARHPKRSAVLCGCVRVCAALPSPDSICRHTSGCHSSASVVSASDDSGPTMQRFFKKAATVEVNVPTELDPA
jgi:hypothetical protein